jgi:hypothetical protein
MLFSMICSRLSSALVPAIDSICKNLYGTSCEIYATDEYDDKDNIVYMPPPLDEVWLDPEGHKQGKLELHSNKNKIKS